MAYAFFAAAVILLFTVGAALQSAYGSYGVIASEVLCIFVPALVFRRLTDVEWPTLRRLRVKPASVLLIVVASAVVGLAANLLAALMIDVIPSLGEMAETYRHQIEQLLQPDDPLRMAVGIVAVCVVAPLCEEFLFRGTMLPGQREHHPAWAAIAVNGLLFSALHVNPMGFVSLFVVGVFLAWLVVRTESLWTSIIAHAAFNTANGVLLPALAGGIARADKQPPLTDILTALAVVLPIAGGLWFLLARTLRPDHAHDSQHHAHSGN